MQIASAADEVVSLPIEMAAEPLAPPPAFPMLVECAPEAVTGPIANASSDVAAAFTPSAIDEFEEATALEPIASVLFADDLAR
jgi:hypothetical protein